MLGNGKSHPVFIYTSDRGVFRKKAQKKFLSDFFAKTLVERCCNKWLSQV
ncbi:hypothetical protein LYNGBM3L_55850 [Moorena producens 3L]|uniref:Uncharacterized protein n=1 Tax=Moorena producens 3L TaxID=489825 RepID=F4XR60_9CYAN|nr:hypothetical protein LYNGBM3L_55850 [Moorena producens 3L]